MTHEEAFSREEYAELIAAAGMSLPLQKKFVKEVDHLVATLRCANFGEEDTERAICRVEKLLQCRAEIFGLVVQSSHWKDFKPAKEAECPITTQP